MKSAKHRTLWELTRGSRLRYSAAILALGLSNVFFFGVPLISKTAIDAIASHGATTMVSLELWRWHDRRGVSYLPRINAGEFDASHRW